MKVAIIGAGLSGLTTAIALRKYVTKQSLEIKIYDKPEREITLEKAWKQGEGLGLQSNGLRVLGDLDPKLKDKICAAGFPCNQYKWKTQGNVLIGREKVDVMPISRPFLIQCLMEALPSDVDIVYKTISQIQIEDGQNPVLHFEDGSPAETADLVIGADGVGSLVRKIMFGTDKAFHPEYLGISVMGGVLEMPIPKHLEKDPAMIFIMGNTGNCGYTGLTQQDKNKVLFWSVFRTELPPKTKDLDLEKVHRELRERHRVWADPVIQECIEKADINNIYPVLLMPDLPYWGRDGCVLVGDAAHAFPPRSGQGTSQAFEDAQALALMLEKRLASHDISPAVDKVIHDLYDFRHDRVNEIRKKFNFSFDPEMPIPWYKMWMLYAVMFYMVRVSNFKKGSQKFDSWDAKTEVLRYLEKSR